MGHEGWERMFRGVAFLGVLCIIIIISIYDFAEAKKDRDLDWGHSSQGDARAVEGWTGRYALCDRDQGWLSDYALRSDDRGRTRGGARIHEGVPGYFP